MEQRIKNHLDERQFRFHRPYGPYISDGKVNVALKGDLTPENITLEQAVDLINQKRLTPSKKRKKRKKKK